MSFHSQISGLSKSPRYHKMPAGVLGGVDLNWFGIWGSSLLGAALWLKASNSQGSSQAWGAIWGSLRMDTCEHIVLWHNDVCTVTQLQPSLWTFFLPDFVTASFMVMFVCSCLWVGSLSSPGCSSIGDCPSPGKVGVLPMGCLVPHPALWNKVWSGPGKQTVLGN